MLARRRRWATHYDSMLAVFRHQLVAGFLEFVEALPEPCFEDWEEGDSPFTVPLLTLLQEPAAAIERLFMCVYDDDTLKLEIFHKLRERLATNVLLASGFAPTVNVHEVSERLILPTRHKSKDPAELAELYLAGTPLAPILELPVPFRVPDEARFEHAHILGGTGHGKTQLLQRMIHADLIAAQTSNRSVVVIDSQGDLISKLVRLELFDPAASNSLADRLILIDPADIEYPPALNLFDPPLGRLQEYRPVDQERVLNGVIELYEDFFRALLGAELTQKQGVIFRYLARLMISIPGATVFTLMELMEDGKAFRPQMEALPGAARYFFEKEFFHPSFSATKKQILKRLWGVLSTPAFERMLAQKENKIDLFAALNEGKIVLINTAKDLLKSEGSQVFGRFFISMLTQAALERSTVPEHARVPAFVYVDEAQEYFGDTIETILSQARKYKVSIHCAHQTLAQLSPHLRAAFLSNTSFKCIGGVSAGDARTLASELHTTPEFIESMRRERDRTEFAVWVKHWTPHALRLSVPLGFLERQQTLSEEAYDALLEANRSRYCGTIEAAALAIPTAKSEPPMPPRDDVATVAEAAPPDVPRRAEPHARPHPSSTEILEGPRPVLGQGKGGAKHRYLQSLVKELAELQGFRATIEAALPDTSGQVDVLLARGEMSIAVEVSVTTPAEYERQNVRKCLDAGYDRVAVVLAKSRATQGRYRDAIIEGLSDSERTRVSFLAPEDIPDYLASLAPPPGPSETVVRGYKVKVSQALVTPEEARERRERLAKLVARSLSSKPDSLDQ